MNSRSYEVSSNDAYEILEDILACYKEKTTCNKDCLHCDRLHIDEEAEGAIRKAQRGLEADIWLSINDKPIDIASTLINAIHVRESFFGEEIDSLTVDELEQIAKHLLIFCEAMSVNTEERSE